MAITRRSPPRGAAGAARAHGRRGDKFTEQLSAILEAVAKVSELDLSDVEPTAHPLDLVNVWADDDPRPSLPVDEARERPGPARRLLQGAARMTRARLTTRDGAAEPPRAARGCVLSRTRILMTAALLLAPCPEHLGDESTS